MIVITQPNATEEQIQRIVTRVREFGLEAQVSRGASRVIIGVVGPEALLREKPLAAMAGVEAIVPVLKPYKLAARDSRGASSVAIGNVRLGEHEDVVLKFCAAARLSRGLRRTVFRGYAKTDFVSSRKRARKRACLWSLK